MCALLAAQIAGYYEPADRPGNMAADLDYENVPAHARPELVPALQDSNWALLPASAQITKAGTRGRGERARRPSPKGDSASAMLDLIIAETGRTATFDICPEELLPRATIAQSMEKGPGSSAPHVMRASLFHRAVPITVTLFVHRVAGRKEVGSVTRVRGKSP